MEAVNKKDQRTTANSIRLFENTQLWAYDFSNCYRLLFLNLHSKLIIWKRKF